MPQETNLNVNPYFDDFDKNKNFYRVLFKPGSPVQARELTGLQSILQNQIEQFGTHFFKEGAKVIPGNVTYDNNYSCVQIESNFLGIPVELYIDQLVGVRITGSRSGVTATIRKVLKEEDSNRGNLTLYIKYEQSGADFQSSLFEDGESLLTSIDIVFGVTVIAAGEPFANTLIDGSAATGSAFSVGEGVYFLRGTFAQVQSETIILDQYGDQPSYRVGFNIEEKFVTADEDTSLNDNASGYTNFAAPGADRFQMSINLQKKDLKDFNDQNFVEIARIEGGQLQTFVTETQYNLINDTLAKRTFDESGNYYVSPFGVHIRECLDDGIGSDGIYTSEQLTAQGNTPTNDLMVIKISPGIAYVKGYRLEKIAPTFLDVPKPRSTREVKEEAVTYSTGNPLFVNNISGSPSLGIGTTATVSLISRRKGNSGSEIGLARLYDFKAQSGSFVNASTQYEIRLFDVKTFTDIKVGTAITSLSATDRIQGTRSGATGYVVSAITNSTNFSLVDVSGKFLKNESITINGIADGRLITKVDTFGFDDVASLESAVGVSTFSADVVLDKGEKLTNIISGNFQLTNANVPGQGKGNGGVIKSAGKNFAGIITSNNIVSYTVPGETTPRFNRIIGVSTEGSEIQVVGIPTVTGVCGGGVHDGNAATTLDVNDLQIRRPSFTIGENSLLTPLDNPFVESIDVTNTTIQVRKQYSDITVAFNSFTTPNAGKNLFFQPFDEERYFLSYENGAVEPLTSDQVEIADDKKTVTFVGLSQNDVKANLFATVLKSKVTNKQKKLNEANVLILNRSTLSSSGIGTNTLNDGLTFSNVFGTRVQDEKISLNVPDAAQLLGVFESNDTSEPDLPSITLSGFSGPNSNNADLIIGEKLTGLNSNAVVAVIEKSGTDAVGIVNLNEKDFEVGETVRGEKSGITAVVAAIANGDRDITDYYKLNTGQRPTFYDYSFIERNKEFSAPEKKLKIVFKNFFVEESDTGDFYNASSYPAETEPLIPTDPSYRQLVTDLIDLRPRVVNYDPSNSSSSPFTHNSRQFTTTGDGSLNPLVSEENLIVNYNYYLGRKDRLFIDKTGDFVYLQGVPSEEPQEPQAIGDAMEVAKFVYTPFLTNVSQAHFIRTKHKRFTMADIGRLEKRLENVEYYTRLSMLELETSTLNITDANGLSRFKCGFFVDNFKKHSAHQIGHPDFSASTDAKNGYLRPGHFTTCLDLVPASKSKFGLDGVAKDPNVDLLYANDISGTGIRKTRNTITLDYTEVVMLEQIYSSRIENVNPFLIAYYDGDMKLFPDSDTWMDTKKIDAAVMFDTSQYELALLKHGIDAETGYSEVDWGAWQTDWVGEKVTGGWVETIAEQKFSKVSPDSVAIEGAKLNLQHIPNYGKVVELNGKWVPKGAGIITDATLTTKQKYEDIEVTTEQSREGIQYQISSTTTEEVIGEKIVSADKVPFMRKRQIEVDATTLKPRTRFYPYFDGQSMSEFCSPKLIEISMVSGVFEVGETVEGSLDFGQIDPETGGTFHPLFKEGAVDEIVFRLASPNHREGPYNAPTRVYQTNPYQTGVAIPAAYSSSSTLLNIDTFSLVNMVDDEFMGRVKKGMKLVGRTSGAEAIVQEIKYVTDALGSLKLVLGIPDPKFTSVPKFESGIKTFRLTTSSTNSQVQGVVKSHAEANFYAQGTLNTVQETVLSTKVPQVKKLTLQDQRVLNETISRKVGPEEKELTGIQYYDPLAQTFRVDDTSGVYLTSVTVFFRDKDDTIPVTIQLRTVQTGLPTSKILPFSVVSKDPNEVNTSEDGTVGTTFTFDSPVYVEGEQEYAIVLVTPSENYTAWISRMGEVDISTANLPDSEQVRISQQPYLGSLFKSQNGTTWDPSQLEDMKFVLRKARFNTGSPGTARFLNPGISVANDLIKNLPKNSVEFLSRKATIGIGTTLPVADQSDFTSGLKPGVIIKQAGNEGASATLLGVAGIATINGSNDISIINAGVGFTPSAGTLTYSSIPTVTLTGSGSGAIADVTVINGVVGAVTFTNGGNNYVVGDTVGLGTLGKGNGSGEIIAIGVVTTSSTLLVDNVQGSFNIGVGTVLFNNGSAILSIDGKTGIGTTVDGQIGSAATVSSFDVDPVFDGLHFKVNHRAHAMHNVSNRVSIKGIQPDTPITTLTADYAQSSLGNISVVDSSSFETFEGVGVGTTNYGYAMINDLEIVAYTGVTNGQITGITTRGIGPRSFMIGNGSGQNTPKKSYNVGAQIQKYEINGINLRRINAFHTLNDVDTTKHPIGLDDYTIKVDMSADKGLNDQSPGADRTGSGSLPAKFFNVTKTDGGTVTRITRNIQYETLTPNVSTTTPPGTSVSGKIRTISGSSIGGSEESFVDQGFEDITLNDMNHFETPRIIASQINANANLTDIMPAGKSIVFEIVLTSDSENVSPMIDCDRIAAVLTSNRLNSGDFVNGLGSSDSRVQESFMKRTKLTGQDPNASVYISKMIKLENPATSILLEFSGYRRQGSEIRAFYKTMEEGSNEETFSRDFEPFPGFSNVDQFEKVIDPSRNTGEPDQNVPPSVGNEFREYTFNSREIPSFTAFQIKIVMVGTNQAQPPKIKELRGIAFA
jgi:hypothetical protein